MRAEPQACDYTPDPRIAALADWLGDPVSAAEFPDVTLRFRNQRWDGAVGLAGLSDVQWLQHFGRDGNRFRALRLAQRYAQKKGLRVCLHYYAGDDESVSVWIKADGSILEIIDEFDIILFPE